MGEKKRNLVSWKILNLECLINLVAVVQLLSHHYLFATPWTAAHHASLSSTIFAESAQTHVHQVSDAIQPYHPPSPPSPLALYISQYQGLSQWVGSYIRWPKYWSFSFSINPSDEYSGLISFRIDWFDLLAVQGTPKSFLQHRSCKASVLWRLGFFMPQLSHPYITTGKTIALTIWTFVGKLMSLLYNMLRLGLS